LYKSNLTSPELNGRVAEPSNSTDPVKSRPPAWQSSPIWRAALKIPPTVNQRFGIAYSSVCGSLVRIEIERATGSVRIAKAYTAVECGQALVPEVVVGQAQGGFAMGVATHCWRSMPLYEDGLGNGKWNLGQYVIARIGLAVERARDRGAPSFSGRTTTRKGLPSRGDIRRAGDPERNLRRHRSPLPIVAGHSGHDQESALVMTMNVTINGKAYEPFEVGTNCR
jgi:hypothetical protein